jgi:protein TonB
MQFSNTPQQEAGSRLGGLGLVILLHAVMIYALASGLVQRITKAPPQKTDVRVTLDTPPPEPEPPRPLLRDALPEVPKPLWTPPIEHWVEVQQTPKLVVESGPPPTSTDADQPGKSKDIAPPSMPLAGLQSAGMLCPVRAQPELPALNVTGMASFKAVGTVRGGRVVAVDLVALRHLSDRRAMRSLAANVERALREGYQCSQDGQFEQEFLFRID